MNYNLSDTLKKHTNRLPIIKVLILTLVLFLWTATVKAENFNTSENWYYTIYCESWECTLYNTWIDINYCVSNNLCPLEWSWFEWSAIYINEIQHEWNDIINITIPEEFDREYENNESWLNLNIIGYWYDTEKIQQMINTQYYKPTSEEMSELVWKIADFLPLVAIALLIIRIWRVLKKVFRF